MVITRTPKPVIKTENRNCAWPWARYVDLKWKFGVLSNILLRLQLLFTGDIKRIMYATKDGIDLSHKRVCYQARDYFLNSYLHVLKTFESYLRMLLHTWFSSGADVNIVSGNGLLSGVTKSGPVPALTILCASKHPFT